jgi:Mg-chelatase subunit ChlD
VGGRAAAGQLLVVLDTSGSMNEPVPEETVSRLDLLRAVAGTGFGKLTARTSIGLWATGPDPPVDHRELVPFGSVDGTVGDTPRTRALVDAVGGLRAGGGAALNDTVYAAFQTIERAWQPGAVNAVVVVTDGHPPDGSAGLSRADLLDRLRAEDRPDRPATVIGLAVGTVGDAAALRDVCAVTGGGTFLVRDPNAAGRGLVLAFAGRLG